MYLPLNTKSIPSHTPFRDEIFANLAEAETYLSGFKWCEQIKNSELFYSLGKVLCIFLFEIVNTQSDDDNFVWVIVGDVPPMYLDTHGPRSVKEVLEYYVDLALDWSDRVLADKSVEDCYPFEIEVSHELAQMLMSRATFIENDLLQNVDDLSIDKSIIRRTE